MVVGIIPARPVIPQTHLAIQVFDVADPRPLRDTEVRMTVVTSGASRRHGISAPSRCSTSRRCGILRWTCPLLPPARGDVSVTVASERGEETFVLPLDVGEPGASIQWIWITAVLVVIITVGAWTWLTLRRRNSAA